MNILNVFRRKSLGLMMAGVLSLGAGFMPEAWADEPRHYTSGDIPFLVSSAQIKDLKANVYRFDAAMILMANTNNRDDFLINRDELWRSREELSYIVKVLEDNTSSPYATEAFEIANHVRELLLKCEDYANNQNEIVAKYNNYKDGPVVMSGVFKNIRETEHLVSKRNFSPEEEVRYVQITSARGAYETAIEDLFASRSSSEMTEVVDRVQKTHDEYMRLINDNVEEFPELKQAFDEANQAFKKMFANKGYGSEMYSYLQLKEVQDGIDAYFHTAVRDLVKEIDKVEIKIKARLG